MELGITASGYCVSSRSPSNSARDVIDLFQSALFQCLSDPNVGKPTKRSLQLYFIVCYNTDRFREFVISEGFTQLYDISADEMQKLLTDDTALMLFGFRFLKQVLFGENTIAMHQETAAKRLEQAREKLQQLEADARAKRATEADEMYEDDEQ